MNKDNGMLWSCMCSLIEILWVLEEKISLNQSNQSKPWQQLSDILETNSLSLMGVLKFFSEIFL